jgi:hypothetical protein
VTAAQVASRLAALREAGAKLRRRPARETLAALARILDGWRDPDSAWRRELEADLPSAAGFAPSTVRAGLARGLDAFHGHALLDLVASELGAADRLDAAGASMVSGFDTTAVVLAGSIPMPTLVALVAPSWDDASTWWTSPGKTWPHSMRCSPPTASSPPAPTRR